MPLVPRFPLFEIVPPLTVGLTVICMLAWLFSGVYAHLISQPVV